MVSLQNLKYLAPHANTDDNATHEYINFQMLNEYTENNTQPQAMIFNQTKTSSIVDVTGDYYLSVIRWNIQSNLPVLVPDMQLLPAGSHYTGLTTYKLAIVFTTANGANWNLAAGTLQTGATVVYQPETTNPNYLSQLKGPSTKEDSLGNPFYYIRSVDTFLKMVNDAITAYIALAGGTWVNKPYFQWDANAGKIVYYVPNSAPTGIAGVDATSKFYIAVNQPLYNLLSTFKFQYFPSNSGNTNFPNTTCRYVLDTDILPTGAGNYTPYYQQASSVVNWSPCQSIVFVSTTMPVEAQFSGAPVNLNTVDASTQASIYAQQSIVKVLTDFIIPFNNGVECSNQQIFYIPSSEYRLVDLLGNQNLQQLTIQVFWRTKYGTYIPMTLDSGASADILVMLRKKSFNKQY